MSIPVLVLGNRAEYFVQHYQQDKIILFTEKDIDDIEPMSTVTVGSRGNTDESYPFLAIEDINYIDPYHWVQHVVMEDIKDFLDHDTAQYTYSERTEGILMTACFPFGDIDIIVKAITSPTFMRAPRFYWDDISVFSRKIPDVVMYASLEVDGIPVQCVTSIDGNVVEIPHSMSHDDTLTYIERVQDISVTEISYWIKMSTGSFQEEAQRIYHILLENSSRQESKGFLLSFKPDSHAITLWALYCALKCQRKYVEMVDKNKMVSRDDEGIINSTERNLESNTIALRKEPLHCVRFVCGNSYHRRIAHKLAQMVGLYSKRSHQFQGEIEQYVCKYHRDPHCDDPDCKVTCCYDCNWILTYRPHTTIHHMKFCKIPFDGYHNISPIEPQATRLLEELDI